MDKAHTVEDCMKIIIAMLEEVQQEAHHCQSHADNRYLIAKRDALTELKFRVRDGRRDPLWARRVLAASL